MKFRGIVLLFILLFPMSIYAECSSIFSTLSISYHLKKDKKVVRPITSKELFMFEVSEINSTEHGIWYLLDQNGKVLHEGKIFSDEVLNELEPHPQDPVPHHSIEDKEDGRYIAHLLDLKRKYPQAKSIVHTHTHPGFNVVIHNGRVLHTWGKNWEISRGDYKTSNMIRDILDRWIGQSTVARDLIGDLKYEAYIVYRNYLTRQISKKGYVLNPGERIQLD